MGAARNRTTKKYLIFKVRAYRLFARRVSGGVIF
jgi:hypothetical protein